MRRLAAGLTGLVTLGVTLAMLPWSWVECAPPGCEHSESLDLTSTGAWLVTLFTVAVYMFIIGAVFTAVLVATLSNGDTADASETAVRAALGETAADARRAALRRGLHDGLWAVGPITALGLIAHVVMLAVAGYGPWVAASSIVGTLVLSATLLASLVTAHSIAVARRGRSAVEQLRPTAPPTGSRATGWRRFFVGWRLAAGFGGVTLVGVAMMVVANMAGPDRAGSWPRSWVLVAGVGAYTASIALFLIVLMGAPHLPRLAGPAMRAAAWLTQRVGARTTSAVIATRSGSTWTSRARSLSALAGLAFLVGALGFTSASSESAPSPEFRTALTVATFAPADGKTCGTDCQAFSARAAGVDGVDTVVPAVVYHFRLHETDRMLVLVSPADLKAADSFLAESLRQAPDTVVWGELAAGEYGSDDYSRLGLPLDGSVMDGYWGVGELANRDAVESSVDGELAGAWIVYSTPDVDTAEVAATLSVFPGVTTHDSPWLYVPAYVFDQDAAQRVWSAVMLVILLALVIAPIAAIATGNVIRRRREDATLAALGASAGTIRASVVIESVVTAGVALVGGLAAGIVMHIVAVASESAVSTAWTGFAIKIGTGVPWTFHALILAIGLGAFAVASWIASRAARSLTPVEALRPAKEGVLS